MNIQVCRNSSDAVALYLPQRLYIKSFAKLNISVQLPSSEVHGKSISNWELMEKLRKMVLPESFSILKVAKINSEVIRFEAELEDRSKLERVVSRLDERVVQLTNYPASLKLRASEAKSDYPSRHSWDSFFRDATDMDEMKPGERPDTIHISNLPIRWFVSSRERDEDAPPSESIFKKAFEKFGSLRRVDVPAADPFRMQMKAIIRGVTIPPQDAALYFEGYLQFNEYVSFVRCMDALRGCKLLRKQEDGTAEWCGICVNFDKTKHMTDAAVKRRAIVRERLAARQRNKDDQEKLEKEKAAKKETKERLKRDQIAREKLELMREREKRRKSKQLAKLMERRGCDVQGRLAEQKKKLVQAQRKLQAINLIEELFKRIELRPHSDHGSRHQRYYKGDEAARERIVAKYKKEQEAELELQRDLLQQAVEGRIVIRSALEVKKQKVRKSSSSSLSSAEEVIARHKKIKTERLTTPEREIDYNKTGMYGMPPPYGYAYPFPHPAPAPMHAYAYPHQTNMYYSTRGAYYPPPQEYAVRRGAGMRRGRGRGQYRGGQRFPYFDGPNASHEYYKYFKKLTETEERNEHDDRARSRSRSRRRSYTSSRSRSRHRSRSRSRTRSRSRRRSYTRSRSRNRRSRSHSRRSRSRSRKPRSRSHSRRSRSRSHSRRSRSKNRKTRSPSKKKSRSRSKERDNEQDERPSVDSSKFVSPTKIRHERSKSWSLPKDGQVRKSWSKSPSKEK